MNKIVSILILLCVSVAAFAQGSVKGDAVLNNLGQPIPFASIRVGTANATNGGNPNTPITPLDTIYTDATLTASATNPFQADANGNFSFYATPGFHVLQVCASGINCYTTTVLLSPDANNFGTMFGASVVSNCGGSPSSCSPAITGFVRLGANDSVCWRNNANTADVCISKNGSDQIVGVTSSATNAQSLTSATANPAGSGVVRLAAGDTACWRNQANTGDVCLTHDANDRINVNGSGFQSPQFQSSSANPALSGVVRIAHNDAVCWRNDANSADVCITQSGGSLSGVGGNANQVTSPNPNPAASGIVRLAAGDTACWRNAGNTADVCLSKDASDRISAASGYSSVNFVSTTANPAASGVVRVASGDAVCWRNNLNTGDICLSHDSADHIVVGGASGIQAAVFESATSTPAVTGAVQLAKTDTICFRNAGNTADVCISKNGSDAIAVSTLNVGGTLTVTGPLTFSGDSITGQTTSTRWASGGSVTGTFTSASANRIFQEFTAPVAITARQLDLYVNTNITGCTTSPVYSIVDITASSNLINVTLTNNTHLVTHTGSANIPSGHVVGFELTTTGVGCTSAQDATWTMLFTNQ